MLFLFLLQLSYCDELFHANLIPLTGRFGDLEESNSMKSSLCPSKLEKI